MIVAFLPKLGEAVRQMLPFFVISFVGGHGDRTELIFSLIGVLGGFGAIGAYVTTRFDIVEGQIVHRSGWIFRRDRRIPLAQIQNVNLRQGVLERLLKVVTLDIETAAGKGAELKLSVLSEPEAERLRSELMAERTRPEEAARDEDVYRISRADLWLGAATEHHVLAFLFSALPLVGLGKVAAATEVWRSMPPGARWAAAVVLTMLGLVAGWAFGAVQYVLRYGGFTVRREPGVTRIAYGLLTKVQVAIRPARIEYAVLTSTPWQRLVARETLAVGTAGSFGEQGTVAKLALMMPRADVGGALGTALPGLDPAALPWRPFPPRYVRVVVGRGAVGFLVACAIAAPFSFVDLPVRWIVMLLPVTVLASVVDRVLGARRAGYAIDEAFVAVRQGFFRRKTEFMPVAKLEVVTLHQPPWWRRRGYVSLGAKAMVHAVAFPILPASVAQGLRDTLAAAARERRGGL